MKRTLFIACILAIYATLAVAKDDHANEHHSGARHSEKERKEDIARHRAIATAHETAAQCLESGKAEQSCFKDLRDSCKGLAIGKYCGMKHQH